MEQTRLANEQDVRGGAPGSTRVLLLVCLAMGALSHGYHLFQYPLYITDEGIYMQQAWAVLRQARLSPYTYFYDHAPAGWLTIAAWVSLLPVQFATFGNAINAGRALMLLVHLANVFFLFHLTYRFSGSRTAAVLACSLVNLSPLAVFYQRQVLLDNLMVFWVLLSLYLATRGDGRIIPLILSGLALGVGVLTKENAVFFAPIFGYLLYGQVRRRFNGRFALGFFSFSSASTVSLYSLYAILKNEFIPTGLNFDLNNPPADHVALLYTIWWQLNRSQGSIFDRQSLVWEFSLGAWLPKDTFLLFAGAAAVCASLALGLLDRRGRQGYLIASLFALSYGFYLLRGSFMLEFYVVPLVPFLAMNIGMVGDRILACSAGVATRWVPTRGDLAPIAHAGAAIALVAVLLSPIGGYVFVTNEFGKIVPHDLYKLPLTAMQTEQLQFVRSHVPPDARIIMDDELWVDLHDMRPFYKWAHSHWKAASDPDVRDKLFAKNWRNIDYIVMSNKMRKTMEENNSDGREDWILTALEHGEEIWAIERGDIRLEVYRVRK